MQINLNSLKRIPRVASRAWSESARYSRATKRERASIRTEIGRETFFRIARPFTDTLEVEWSSGRFLVSTADRDVSRRTFLSGPFDLDGLRLAHQRIREVLGDAFDLKAAEVLDLGANIGTTSVPLVTELGAAKVHSFEPAPQNFRLLQQNVIGNGLEDRIFPHRLALSDTKGQVAFELSPRNSGDNRIRVEASSAPGGQFEESSRKVIQVDAVTVDSLINDGVFDLEKVGLVWIDTQGHEALLLRGASQLLRSRIPIVMEYWPYALRRADSIDLLDELVIANFSHFLDLNKPSDGLVDSSAIAERRIMYSDPHAATNLVLFSLTDAR